MNINRRSFIRQSVASAILAASPNLFAQTLAGKNNATINTGSEPSFTNQPGSEQMLEGWFSPQGSKQETYGFAADLTLANNKEVRHRRSKGLSGFRGHGGAQHPLKANTVLMFGRRPSNETVEVNLLTGEVSARFKSQKNRHFFGHGAFSEDGKTLFTTEADLERNVGVIGIRDALTYEWLGEYESYGVGPHQMMLMPNGKELVVANGGILTRPETGRDKLNLDTMDSSLAYVDVETGKLNSIWRVPESKASIRHLDVADDGTVAIAMQQQRSACEHDGLVALTAIHKSGQPIQLLQEPEMVIEQMNDYVGSVAIHNETRTAGFTSPRGDIVGFWNIDSGDFIGYHAMRDVCGIAVSNKDSAFVVTNSYGMVQAVDAQTITELKQKRKHYPSMAWDNHMISLS